MVRCGLGEAGLGAWEMLASGKMEGYGLEVHLRRRVVNKGAQSR